MLVIDAALSDKDVLKPLQKLMNTRSIRDVRPYEVVKDDRVPVLLRTLTSPTFITTDEAGFWHRHLCSDSYCIFCFALSDPQQELIPSLLRRLLRLPEFKTKANRIGKVVRVSLANIKYYQLGDAKLHALAWPKR
ncbi:hypothetical protein L0337_08800 [candidate division KSB1 bacterium]|nr:hypothetical protein [candidate division KSB1 bacterium]